MSTLEKQNEFDKKKWEDSLAAGHDTCGEYDYCAKCNKSHEYPCAKAYDEYTSSVVTVETTPVVEESVVTVAPKKTCAKKTCTKTATAKKTCAKAATKATTTKKTAAKKTTAKKTTTKKTK